MSLPATARSYNWRVPNLPTNKARIRVIAYGRDGVNGEVWNPGNFFIVTKAKGSAGHARGIDPTPPPSGWHGALLARAASRFVPHLPVFTLPVLIFQIVSLTARRYPQKDR